MYPDKKVKANAWAVSTGIKVPYIFGDWMKGHPLIPLGDNFVGEWMPRYEFLIGESGHIEIIEAHGTQPANTYLRGHFAVSPHAGKGKEHVIIQQYFKAGCWGGTPPSVPWAGVSTVKEQLAQNNVGVPLLFELGIFKSDTEIWFKDQSKIYEPNTPGDWYRKHLKGKDCLEHYYSWLPIYFRRLRRDDFNVSIEEVIACIPQV